MWSFNRVIQNHRNISNLAVNMEVNINKIDQIIYYLKASRIRIFQKGRKPYQLAIIGIKNDNKWKPVEFGGVWHINRYDDKWINNSLVEK